MSPDGFPRRTFYSHTFYSDGGRERTSPHTATGRPSLPSRLFRGARPPAAGPAAQHRVDLGRSQGRGLRAVDLAVARGNMLLNQLTDADLAELLTEAAAVELTLGTVLSEPGQPVVAVHFPLSGVVSFVTDLGEGDLVEAATVGDEGMCGISVFLGAGAPTERASVQVAGRAVSLSAAAFERAVAAVDGPLYAAMRRYTQALFTQLARNAGCNRVHTVRQRTARWLLTAQDRMHSPTFQLTQDFLAQMLAVRRASVSREARSLAADGCITYLRGTLTILDRPRLQSHACACYQAVRDSTERAHTPAEDQR